MTNIEELQIQSETYYQEVLCIGRYIEDITWWQEDVNFMFEWQEQYLTSEGSE